MFDVYGWLRTKVKAAFLHGVQDAIEELEGEQNDDNSPNALAARMKALAAPPEETESNEEEKPPARKGRKT